MGSAEALPEAPKEKITFAEDMTEGQLLKADKIPPGLVNLGNTCYLNSVIQCLRMIPELGEALAKLSSDSETLLVTLASLWKMVMFFSILCRFHIYKCLLWNSLLFYKSFMSDFHLFSDFIEFSSTRKGLENSGRSRWVFLNLIIRWKRMQKPKIRFLFWLHSTNNFLNLRKKTQKGALNNRTPMRRGFRWCNFFNF